LRFAGEIDFKSCVYVCVFKESDAISHVDIEKKGFALKLLRAKFILVFHACALF